MLVLFVFHLEEPDVVLVLFDVDLVLNVLVLVDEGLMLHKLELLLELTIHVGESIDIVLKFFDGADSVLEVGVFGLEFFYFLVLVTHLGYEVGDLLRLRKTTNG